MNVFNRIYVEPDLIKHWKSMMPDIQLKRVAEHEQLGYRISGFSETGMVTMLSSDEPNAVRITRHGLRSAYS